MRTSFYEITFPTDADVLWRYTVPSGPSYEMAPPRLELDGQLVTCHPNAMREVSGRSITGHVSETVYEGEDVASGLALRMIVRSAQDSPVLRYRYEIRAAQPRTMTKSQGVDQLVYTEFTLPEGTVTDVHFSEFQESIHTFTLAERKIDQRWFDNKAALMGPMLTSEGRGSALWAYEHGSQVPDAFVQFKLSPERKAALCAVKGNYYAGRVIDDKHPFDTIWFQFAATGDARDVLQRHYRDFVLRDQCPNPASREPHIYYNSWCYQERNKWYNGAKYLDSMNQERMLEEIDVAHEMGVDVFVIDTGWYEKTGDWNVNRKRFPDNLKSVREKLDAYGMKMGLWFDPQAAAKSSRILATKQECIQERKGVRPEPHPVWETEESYRMCLASEYADAFADELIRAYEELGVQYFKWDAVGQYGCDAPHHHHGTQDNSREERADCYAFEVGRAMIRVVERLTEAAPDAIVDFDITEGRRYVGLSFLSVGKYFSINNGPYFANYDIPIPDVWTNIFVHPGPARGWICRRPLNLDSWLPSVLFMAHYLPDAPEMSQWINLASLMLGQNGIWGDLPALSGEDIARFHDTLTQYKKVKYDITQAYPVRLGEVGGAPEVHEKIHDGRGMIVLFGQAGRYTYISEHPVADTFWANPYVKVSFDAKHRAVLDVTLHEHGAGIVFFGV